MTYRNHVAFLLPLLLWQLEQRGIDASGWRIGFGERTRTTINGVTNG